VDRHYQLVSSADSAYPGPDAILFYDSWPIPPYILNDTNSAWISARANAADGNTAGANLLDGVYVYRTSFMLDTLDPNTAEIRGRWAMDNYGLDIKLNGVSLGISNNTGFATYSTFGITSGFVAGSNTLDFVISNAPPPGPSALRVELYGVAKPLPPSAPEIVSQPQSQFAQELSEVIFSVVATGSPNLTYQWFFEGLDLLDQTNRTLRLTGVTQLDFQGSYWVVITNPEGSVESDPAVLTINALPEAGADYIACAQDLAVTVPAAKFLANDSEFEGDTLSMAAVSSTSLNNGSASLSAGLVTYTPPAGFTGADEFTYTLADSRGARVTGRVYVTVGATNFISVVTPPALQSNGHFQVGYQGIPGYLYVVERATNVLGPWEVLTTVYADGNGNFQVDDPNDPPEPMRFYRVTYP
jgi:hypothetical protein